MKRLTSIILFFCLIFLAGCSNSNVDMNNLKVDILKENKKVESIVTSFEMSKEKSEIFNNLFHQSFFNVGLDTDFSKYLNFDRDLNSTIEKLNEIFNESYNINYIGLDKESYLDKLKSNYESYLFMDETTGNIEDLIILKDGYNIIFITFMWEDGKIVNYSFDNTI